MKIQGDLQPIQQTSEIPQSPAISGNKVGGQSTTELQNVSNDETHVSTAANLVNQSLSAPDVRTDKVASLQAQILTGGYKVESSGVAAKLIDHMLGSGT
jgi:flagellar biosynthesis anti-sigma factor FlgM